MVCFIESLAVLRSNEKLERLGFTMKISKRSLATYDGDVAHPLVQAQDKTAGDAMRYWTELVSARLHRMLWLLRGMLGLFARLTDDDPAAVGRALQRIKRAYEAWCALSDHPNRTRYMNTVLERSYFNNMAILNLCRLLRDNGWSMNDDARSTVQAMFGSFGQSKVVEDANHHLRALETRQQNNEVSTSVRMWHRLLVKRILSEAFSIHHASGAVTSPALREVRSGEM